MHQKCEEIIDYAVDNEIIKTQELGDIEEKIDNLKKRNEELSINLESERMEIEKEAKSVNLQIKNHIDIVTENVLLKVNEIAVAEGDKNKESLAEISIIQANIRQDRALLDVLNMYGTKSQHAVMANYFEIRKKEAMTTLDRFESTSPKRMIFKPQKRVLETQTIGEVLLTSEAYLEEQLVCSDELADSEEAGMKRSDCRADQIPLTLVFGMPKSETPFINREVGRHIHMHSVKTQSDKSTPCITGIQATPSGNILLADRENSKLKLFTRTFVLLDEMELNAKPIDICLMADTVYICCEQLKQVLWFTMSSDDRLPPCPKMYPTRLQPVSTSTLESSLLILFSEADYDGDTCGKVEIQTRVGNSIQANISYTSLNANAKCVEFAKRILGVDTYAIYLSEKDEVAYYPVDAEKKELSERPWFYKSTKRRPLKSPRGLTLDSEKNVYICGQDSNNVHQVLPGNFRKSRILVKDITSPISVFVDEINDRIIIGCKSDNYIHTFSMT